MSTDQAAQQDAPERDPLEHELSKGQLEILRAIAQHGRFNEAAKALFLSEDTVKSHAQKAYRKLGVNSAAAAVRVLAERGLLAPESAPVTVPLEMVRHVKYMARFEPMSGLKSGVGSPDAPALARRHAEQASRAAAEGGQSYAHLVMRELTAALAATNRKDLRRGLVRTGAVLIAWILDLDGDRR